MKRIISHTKQDLLSVQPPASTSTYKTISHGAIIDTVYEELDKEGFVVREERFSATANRHVMNGHLILNIDTDADLKFEIAMLNSYNKTKRAIVAGGSQVFICENGHILGDTSYGCFKRKHVGTADLDIVPFIKEMVKSAGECFDKLIRQKDAMKQIEVDKKIRNELIGQLYIDDAIIADTQMSLIRDQINKPSFDYKSDGTLWQLYNHITYGLKNSHPSKWIRNHQVLNDLVAEKFQLV